MPSAATTTPSSGASSSPSAAASGSLTTVLRRAMQEERGAKATYDNVLVKLGQVRPFVAIAAAEARHITALETVSAAHAVNVADITSTGLASPDTLAQACALGVTAEKADIALYDILLPQVQAYPDVVQVFTNLRAASADSHLPAFERC